MKTYDEVCKALPANSKPSLFLGNGFSTGHEPNFNYDSLWGVAASQGLFDKRVESIGRHMGTTNFEEVLLFLSNLRIGADAYGLLPDPEFERAIEDDIRSVRGALAKAISKIHLTSPGALNDNQVAACAKFISKFHTIFTTNYDLLLYWVTQRGQSTPDKEVASALAEFADGFGASVPGSQDREFAVWAFESRPRRFLYLHGALHLYESGGGTIKRVSPKKAGGSIGDTKITLIEEFLRDQVVKAIEAGTLPLFVAEGSTESKRERIGKSSYLKFCHEYLGKVNGDLVTLGFSFSSVDYHIAERIAGNPGISRVFVGARPQQNGGIKASLVAGVDSMLELRKRRVKSQPQAFKELEIIYFDATTVKPWG